MQADSRTALALMSLLLAGCAAAPAPTHTLAPFAASTQGSTLERIAVVTQVHLLDPDHALHLATTRLRLRLPDGKFVSCDVNTQRRFQAGENVRLVTRNRETEIIPQRAPSEPIPATQCAPLPDLGQS